MTAFILDTKLKKECILLGELDTSLLLLMDNSLLPWFIIVPQTTEIEIVDLIPEQQFSVQQEVNLVSSFIKNNFSITKLNIASIGNIVSQLHIHVVGRISTDYCWPNVVWGTTERRPYPDSRVQEILQAIQKQLGDKFRIAHS